MDDSVPTPGLTPPEKPEQPAPQQPAAQAPSPTQPTPQQPAAPAPAPAQAPATPPAQPAPAAPQPAAPQPAGKPPQTPEQAKAAKKAAKEKKKKKKLVIGLLGVLAFVFFMVFLMAFFILSQSGSGSNPLLQLFGVSEEELYPFLINMANIFFGLFDFIVFIVALIGVFLFAMAKKDDKKGKKRGLMMLITGVLFFVLFSVTWAASYFYLEEKKAQYATQTGDQTEYILTVPEETTNLTAPARVEFDASPLEAIVDTNKYEIISYFWDFGDGNTGTGKSTSHLYNSKGEDDGRYIVELSVVYRDRATSEENEDVFNVDVVFANEKVNAAFTASPESGAIPLIVTFDASSSLDPDGEVVEYEWDLDGDGSYDDGDGVTIEYTYEKYGDYDVKLRVTDNNGETDTAEMTIIVNEGDKPTATVDVTLEEGDILYVGKEYLFNAENPSSPNGSVTNYEWDFGDGSSVTKNRSASHTYDAPGNYTIALELKDEDNAINVIEYFVDVVTEASAPTAVITTDQDWSSDGGNSEITGEVPFAVEFSAEDSSDPDDDIVDFQWDLDGDGVIDEAGEEVEFIFQETGEFTATLYVEDSEGNQSMAGITVFVESQNMTAELTASTLTGETPLSVTFDASGSSYPDGQIVNYKWDFGDGTMRYDQAQVTYSFDSVGTFTVEVTAIASDGVEATDSLFINVLPVSLGACFETNVDSGDAPLIVTFNPTCSTGTVDNYRWAFGDGDISYARKPTHTFDEAGTFTVVLTVEDADGVSDDFEATISVHGDE